MAVASGWRVNRMWDQLFLLGCHCINYNNKLTPFQKKINLLLTAKPGKTAGLCCFRVCVKQAQFHQIMAFIILI
jgi:hypothetical protein